MKAIRGRITADRARLNRDAVHAYVLGVAGTQISSLFNEPGDAAGSRKEYEDTVVGDVSADAATLEHQQSQLSAAETAQKNQEQAAQNEANQAQALEQSNAAASAAAQATLNQVQGTLAQQVAAAAEAQAQKEAAAAAAAKSAAAAAALLLRPRAWPVSPGPWGDPRRGPPPPRRPTRPPRPPARAAGRRGRHQGGRPAAGPSLPPGTSPTDVGPSGGSTAAGNAALQAAESQLGVPYVWGGETPGVGFDCSGLTQWSWAQAGVSIPRTAAGQYSGVTAVPLNALEPGDLLFYYDLDGDNIVDHVVMYAGSGPYGTETIIQAPYTGATVSYALLYTYGLIGAGRP